MTYTRKEREAHRVEVELKHAEMKMLYSSRTFSRKPYDERESIRLMVNSLMMESQDLKRIIDSMEVTE
jgi:hypothetical protein